MNLKALLPGNLHTREPAHENECITKVAETRYLLKAMCGRHHATGSGEWTQTGSRPGDGERGLRQRPQREHALDEILHLMHRRVTNEDGRKRK